MAEESTGTGKISLQTISANIYWICNSIYVSWYDVLLKCNMDCDMVCIWKCNFADFYIELHSRT